MRIGFLSKPLLVNEHLGFVFETNLRYNDEFYGNPESGFNNLEFFLYAPVFLNRNARIIPFVRYNEAFEATDFFQDSEFTGGVTLQVVF